MEDKELIVKERLDVAVLFSSDGMDKVLKEIEQKAMAHVPDVLTDQGRKDIASMAHRVSRSKTLIDGIGKELVSDWKKKAKAIDDHRKTARDFLDNLKATVRQPLTDYEDERAKIKAEEERKEKEKINVRISELQKLGCVLPFMEVATMTDDEYSEKLSLVTAEYEDEQKRKDEEEAARKAESERLEAERKRQEEEAEKLAEERRKIEAEKAAIEEQKRIEQASHEAAEKARIEERERIEREQREKDAAEKAAKERAEREDREKAKAEQRAKEEAERQEALRPDKERLSVWADSILEIVPPELSNENSRKIASQALSTIYQAARDIFSAIKEL